MYEFRNRQNRTMAAQAIPSYAPTVAMSHFNKLECFCFSEHLLKPGEIEAVAGGVRGRREAAEGREDHHPLVHLLRGRRQGAGRARAGRAARTPARGRRALMMAKPVDGSDPRRRRASGSLLRTLRRRRLVVLRRAQVARPRARRRRAEAGARHRRRRRGRRRLRRRAWFCWSTGSSPAASPHEFTKTFFAGAHTMSAVTEGAKPYYFVPAPSRHPASVAFGMLLIIFGASQWVNGAQWGAWVVLAGFVAWIFVMQQWFRDAIARERGRALQQARRRLVPLEHELVHLLGGDVLRRLLRRALLDPAAHAAGARQPRERGALARLQGGLAERGRRLHRLAGRHRRPVRDHGPVAAADPQHGAAAHLGRDADDRAPRAASPASAARRSSGCGSP